MSKYKYEMKNKIAYYKFKGKKRSDINIVFIHGTACTKDFLVSLKDTFEDYNTYFFDLPGHGDSENTGYSVENYINSILDFIKNLDNVILIGHSLGAALTAGVIGRKPSNVKGALIVCGGLHFRNLLPRDFIADVKNGVINTDLVLSTLGHLEMEEVKQSVETMTTDEAAVNDWLIDDIIDVSEGIENVEIPVKIITGKKDILVPPQKSEEMAEKIQNSELIIFDEGMHMLIIAYKNQIKNIADKLIETL